jgi:hypothetical protein
MEAFKRANEGRSPTQMDIQEMITILLMKTIIQQPAWSVDPFSGFSGFLFEAGKRPDGSTVDIAV